MMPRSTRQATAADIVQEERAELSAAYRRAKKRQFDTLESNPDYGESFKKFRRHLRIFNIHQSDKFVSFVRNEGDRWLLQAPPEVRAAALEVVDTRIQALRLINGLPPFDDPLPGAEDDVFLLCKKALGL